MNDIEMVKACAMAMKIIHRTVKDGAYLECPHQEVDYNWDGVYEYDPGSNMWSRRYSPLHDDAQAMALGKVYWSEFEQAVIEWCNHMRRGEQFDLNRELCGRVAKLHAEVE
jgi:hypothetical protein